MPKPFPTQPSLEHFRKQAKQLLRDLRAGHIDAAARVRRSHPRWSTTGGPSSDASLHDAQLVVAREFGFASWRRLQTTVTRPDDESTGSQRILITGGAGFIGSHLAEALVGRGHHVLSLDDLSTGSQQNVAHLLKQDRFDLIVGDVCDADVVDRLVAEADVTFHLAADIGHSPDVDTLRLWRTNVDGTEVVVDACSRHDVRFMLTSSSVVYGKTDGRETLREDADLILESGGQPGWDYAVSKVANEQLTQAHMARHNLRATIVRPFNVIGPRSTAAVVPKFVQQARGHAPITVHGDGTHRRCFTDVRDVVEAFVRLAASPDACGETVNVGSRDEYSLLQLADLVKSATHSESPVTRTPYDQLPMGEYQRHIPWKTPNLSKARKLVGYSPVHSIQECLHEIVALGDGPGSPES